MLSKTSIKVMVWMGLVYFTPLFWHIGKDDENPTRIGRKFVAGKFDVPTIILLGPVQHKLNYFQLCQNFQKNSAFSTEIFKNTFKLLASLELGTCLSESITLHPSDH